MKTFINEGCEVLAAGNEFENDPETQWKIKFAENNIKYKQIYVQRNGMNPLKDIKTYKSIKRLLKEEKPDKIFVYQAKTVIYGCLAAKANGITEVYPLIAGLGSIFRGTGLKNLIIKFIMKTEYRMACKRSNKIFFQNNDDKQEFLNNHLTSEDKIVIINGSGVNIEKFIPTPLPKKTGFLFIGRLIKDKGICEYLEACKCIKEKYKDVRCMLVGPYDSNPSALKPEEIQPYIDVGIIEYYGEQSDVRPYINQCSVFVLPSYHEGTPKTVLEAMASGRAVITTDAPGCRETVKDGDNGYLIPIKDINTLIEKMALFIEQPETADNMGLKGRQTAVNKYDVNKVNKSISDIMKINKEYQEAVNI
jgi:glycosyltransferase involved in cell wall biosynthesis